MNRNAFTGLAALSAAAAVLAGVASALGVFPAMLVHAAVNAVAIAF